MIRLPFFRTRPLVGIDISDASVEILVLEQEQGFRVRGFARAVLPPGIVVRGSIQDPNKLSDVLRALREKIQSDTVHADEVVFGIPEEFVYVRRVLVAKKPGGTWRTGMEKAVAASVPYELSAVVWDAKLAATREQEWEVLLLAVPRCILEAYQGVLRAVGFRPRLAMADSFALAQAFFPDGPKAPTLIVDIGTTTTILSVFDRRGMYASTNVAVGGETLTQAIVAQRSCSPEEAEQIKRSAGLLPDAEQGAVFLLLQKTIQPLIQGAEALIGEYGEAADAAPTQMVVAGGTALLPGITTYLGAVLDLETIIGTVTAPLAVSSLSAAAAALWKKSSGLYAVAVGLALYGFLPEEKRFFLMDAAVREHLAEEGNTGEPQQNSARRVCLAVGGWTRAFLHTRRVWLVAACCIVGLVVGALWYAYRSGTFSTGALSDIRGRWFGGGGRTLTFPLTVALSATSSPSAMVVGMVHEVEEAGERQVALVEKTVGKSTGTVRIRNTTDRPRSLPAGFRLQTASGTLFALRDAVTIPVHGSVASLFVQAEAEGEQGDIAPQAFTIADPSLALQGGLRISAASPFHGGAPVGIVTADAVTRAEQELADALFTTALRTLEQKDPARFFLREGLERRIVAASSPPLGTVLETDAITRLRVHLRTLSLTEEQLSNAAGQFSALEGEAGAYAFDGWEIRAGAIDVAHDTATLSVTVRATAAQ